MDIYAPPQNPPQLPPKNSGLAIASLICGILGISCLSLVGGIPAVICGHLALANIKKSPSLLTGGGMAIAGLVMGYISILIMVIAILAGVAVPVILAQQNKAREAEQCSDAKLIFMAMTMAAVDGKSDGKTGFPADIGASTSREVIDNLVAGGYLKVDDKGRQRLDAFEIGNVSDKDTDNTILIRSNPEKSYYKVVILLKSGEVQAVRQSKVESIGTLPPRDPQFLP